MSKIDRHAGLQEAHSLLQAYHEELAIEHETTPAGLFGRPTRRHHDLLAASNALVELGRRVVKRGAEIVSEKEAA